MKSRTLVIMPLLAIMATDLYAYLDPGSGSMLLQVLLGGIAAIGVATKLYWHKLIRLFRKNDPAQSEEK